MLKLCGQVLQSITKEMKRKDGSPVLDDAGNPRRITTVQVMTQGKEYAGIQNVTDWQNRKWEKGKQEIDVYIRTFMRRGGQPGFNYVAA